jgi:hypothetical protein
VRPRGRVVRGTGLMECNVRPMSDYWALVFAALMFGLTMTTASFMMPRPLCNTAPNPMFGSLSSCAYPTFARGNGPVLAWPLPAPSVFATSFMVPSGPGPDWHEGLNARDAARHEESLRAIAT